jgi:hypothetical protein
MPAAKTEAAEAALPDDHMRVKVRHKGDGKISKGRDGETVSKDPTYATGDVFAVHKRVAEALIARDLVDPE